MNMRQRHAEMVPLSYAKNNLDSYGSVIELTAVPCAAAGAQNSD